MHPNVRPDAARPRLAASALLGALVVVVGWGVWSIMAKSEPPVSALPPGTPVAEAVLLEAPRPTSVPRPIGQAASADVRSARVAASPTAAPLRDGLVLEHGMPTAVHALAADADAQALLPAPPATLPTGALPEDVSVNRAGVVTLKRSVDAPAGGDASKPDASQPAALTRTP